MTRLRSVREPRHRVVIAGGGVAAIEALLALRHLVGEQVIVELLAPEATFVHRPSSVAEPFGFGGPTAIDLDALARSQGARLIRGTLAGADPERRVALLAGEECPYDALIVAVGATPKAVVPGAITFTGPGQASRVGDVLDAVQRGEIRHVVFTLPAGASWSLPIYELAIMAAVELRDRGVTDAALNVVTPEREPLQLFGPAAGTAMREMLAARGVELFTDTRPRSVSGDVLKTDPGPPIRADAVIALPQLVGPHLAGLPADDRGFLPVDAHGRVTGAEGVYAAGDATTFPIKQGGLAAQQADAAAATVAADLGLAVTPEPFRPVMRGLLLTGGAPLYLRAELRGDEPPTSRVLHGQVSTRAVWWPPGKVAGRYLAPYLATARPVGLTAEPMQDRAAGAGRAAPDHDEAYQLALLLAEEDAHVGDYRQALHALDAAAALAGGVLPDEWQENRARWERELTLHV